MDPDLYGRPPNATNALWEEALIENPDPPWSASSFRLQDPTLTYLQHGPSNSHRPRRPLRPRRRPKPTSNRAHQKTRPPQIASRSTSHRPFHIQLHAPPRRISEINPDRPSTVEVRAAFAFVDSFS